MKRLNKKGFTLVELIMVIVIIAILAIVAIPKYFDIQDKAQTAAMMGVVGGIRGGIHTAYAYSASAGTKPSWPTILDDAEDNQVAGASNPLFGSVLDTPVEADWTKIHDSEYVCTGPTVDVTWDYNPSTGKFK